MSVNKFNININPYIDDGYLEKRTRNRAVANVTGKYKAIWKRQSGLCYYCGKPILLDQEREIIQIDDAEKDTLANTAYVHHRCEQDKIEFYNTECVTHSYGDIIGVLQKMEDKGPEKITQKNKFEFLKEYFRLKTESVFTMTFDEINRIIKYPLCKCARTMKQYWYDRGGGGMSMAWTQHNYEIDTLDLEKKYVTFRRVKSKPAAPIIPETFLYNKIPIDACTELENFFAYIKKKYGL
jgi:RNA-directed DNA polymerase